jgi:peptidyl-tRNA hydrolase, PTH1 family
VKLVVGLGNPGQEYADTPHNAGFAVVDRLAGGWSCALRRQARFRARVGRVTVGAEPLLLACPETYMNESGQAVAAVMGYWKLVAADLVVALDDADLPLGALRVRARGGSGGHRGLDSVIRCVGSEDFARVRIGIGRGAERASLREHVLRPLAVEEGAALAEQVERAAEAVRTILAQGVDAAMNRFNAASAADPGDERQTKSGERNGELV